MMSLNERSEKYVETVTGGVKLRPDIVLLLHDGDQSHLFKHFAFFINV